MLGLITAQEETEKEEKKNWQKRTNWQVPATERPAASADIEKEKKEEMRWRKTEEKENVLFLNLIIY